MGEGVNFETGFAHPTPNCIKMVMTRVWSDKYRTGIITIVPVRTETVNLERPKILKKTGYFPTKHFVHNKLEKINFLVILVIVT